MKKMKLHFLAPLSYADDSLLGIEVAPKLKIEKWSIERLIAIIKNSTSFDEDGCREVLRDLFCLEENEEYAYVIGGSYNVEITDEKPLYPLNIDRIAAEGFGGYIAKAENTIKLMRLFKEGSLDMPHIYIYEKTGSAIDPVFNIAGSPQPPELQYSLTANERRNLGKFLKRHSLPFSLPYIQLAFDNFDQSFEGHNLNLKFLCLMIATEVLFNDGSYELKYRITRGMAVLLGTNKSESHEIYSNMKKLYDKRSRLVHTGKAAISSTDVILLRHYLRNSIKELLRLRLSKTELCKKLMESGFGQSLE